jgi:hypothetical protein
MILRRISLLVATVLAVAPILLVAPSETHAGSVGCGVLPYSYAGWQARETSAGVAAIVTSLEAPSVENGHVAAWVGVGGVGQGPGGTDEWLQVGVSAFSTPSSSNIYYEVAVPGAAPQYTEVMSAVPVGVSHRMAVLEMVHRRSWWRVWVDGKPASPPIKLAGSHGAWTPQAVGESWNGGSPSCNRYAFRFASVLQAGGPGGAWKPFQRHVRMSDVGYRVLSSGSATFVATAD